MNRFTRKDVEVIKEESGYQGFFRINRFTLRHRLFRGGWSEPMVRELFQRGSATCVLPYDPVLDEVVLIEQFRVGCVGADAPWLLELVAGINEAGEEPETVARREALEEADLELGTLEPVAKYWASPGGSDEQVQIFCGQVNAKGVDGIFGLAEEHEDIRVQAVNVQTAFEWVASGRINNAATIIALQWLQLHRDQLRARWLNPSREE